MKAEVSFDPPLPSAVPPPGQTVELLERPSERPGWCLVRTTDRSPPQEGLVPSSALCVSHSRSSVEMDCFFGAGKGKENL